MIANVQACLVLHVLMFGYSSGNAETHQYDTAINEDNAKFCGIRKSRKCYKDGCNIVLSIAVTNCWNLGVNSSNLTKRYRFATYDSNSTM